MTSATSLTTCDFVTGRVKVSHPISLPTETVPPCAACDEKPLVGVTLRVRTTDSLLFWIPFLLRIRTAGFTGPFRLAANLADTQDRLRSGTRRAGLFPPDWRNAPCAAGGRTGASADRS